MQLRKNPNAMREGERQFYRKVLSFFTDGAAPAPWQWGSGDVLGTYQGSLIVCSGVGSVPPPVSDTAPHLGVGDASDDFVEHRRICGVKFRSLFEALIGPARYLGVLKIWTRVHGRLDIADEDERAYRALQVRCRVGYVMCLRLCNGVLLQLYCEIYDVKIAVLVDRRFHVIAHDEQSLSESDEVIIMQRTVCDVLVLSRRPAVESL